MVFNSVAFALFFIVVLALYWTVPPRWRNPLLLAGSYFFYGSWDWRFLGLLLISTVVDFSIGVLLDRTTAVGRRKALLSFSMAANLGILGLFKYANFFIDSSIGLLGDLGLEANRPLLEVVLPVGISFYTFQTMSYTIDVYRGRLEPTRNLVVFATFVAYFPQLVAGPIERAKILLPQLVETERRITSDGVASGLGLILLGLTKKVVLADGVAEVADTAFSNPTEQSWIAMGAGILAFAIQIYGDFSGYTDVARGVSRLLGIELTINFAQPYLSRNITEFWRRWHISLSNWLRDYLYIPLGGNRKGTVATYRNLAITMLLGGLWHGASWNFVIWGGLHGGFLVIHKLIRAGRVSDDSVTVRDLPAIAVTFALVCFAWVFFRAATFKDAIYVLRGMAGQAGAWSGPDLILVVCAFVAMVGIDLVARARVLDPALLVRRPALAGFLVTSALLGIALFSGGVPRPFVYFQF